LKNKKIELLAPAKNAEYGKIAINFGADAVYIGAPKFSARSSAGNSLADIENLCTYAHKYNAQVYIALNTILYEHELTETEKLIRKLYNAGADALIIQDMGITEMNLPPIPLHASTQAHNILIEKVNFLEKVGFSRVVLGRELSLKEMAEIHSNTQVELEVFVHGALCVSYSGQCYISQHIGNRSGNRGDCAQTCRLPFDLMDSEGKKIYSNKNVLSLKDMNRASYIEEMIHAGVYSFKIEGRMKDINYLKNNTAFYRKSIDLALTKFPDLRTTSFGKFIFDFVPEPEITFNRTYSDYFLKARKDTIHSMDNPKSKGKLIGNVTNIDNKYFQIKTKETLNNGDGLCFLNEKNELIGVRVEKVENAKIFSNQAHLLKKGTELFRNYDHQFVKMLDNIDNQRFLLIDLHFCESKTGFELVIKSKDCDLEISEFLESDKELATNKEKAFENIQKQLCKMGGYQLVVSSFLNSCTQAYFIQAAKLNELRRNAIENFLEKIYKIYERQEIEFQANSFPYFDKELDYKANVSNSLAEKFYKRHGVEKIEKAFELQKNTEGKELMTTKMCLKFQLGLCEKYQNAKPKAIPKQLKHKDLTFNLRFDCENCVMIVESP